MNSLKERMREKAHNRKINITTFQADDGNVIVEGGLIDNRLLTTHHYSGEVRPPHLVHHLIIRILIGGQSFTIDDVEVEMPGIPHKDCIELVKSLDRIKGMKIAQGFTMKIKEMFAFGKGCAHLTELLLAMAPAAVQGFFTSASTQPVSPDFSAGMENFLTDTCWYWRKDGPALTELKDQFAKNRKN